MNESKNIVLIAHDDRKKDLLIWARKNEAKLAMHTLYGTGTTATVISNNTDLEVTKLISGPLGGDQQIGAMIVEGKIDMMIFFWDPLSTHPHDPDVKALLRIAALYNTVVAQNVSTADFIFNSTLMDEVYDKDIVDYDARLMR